MCYHNFIISKIEEIKKAWQKGQKYNNKKIKQRHIILLYECTMIYLTSPLLIGI